MARMTADERRSRLTAAAIRVMSRDGVAQATTRAICADAEMPHGVFHYCFRSKEELVLQVTETLNEDRYLAVGQVLTSPADPKTLVTTAIATYWRHVEENRDRHLLSYELTQYALRQQATDLAVRLYQDNLANIETLLNMAAQSGSFTWGQPVRLLARIVLGLLEGVTFQYLVDGESEDALESLNVIGDFMLATANLQP